MSEQVESWADARWRFIEAGGRTTQSFGLGRMIGQIYALLYLSPSPLCLDEIADGLAVSKASVSIGVRQLEGWLAVRKVWVKGDRKDYYEAETDMGAVLRTGLMGSLRKKIDTAGEQLRHVEKSITLTVQQKNGDDKESLKPVAGRLNQARKFHKKLDSLVNNPLIKKLL